jgi:O-antigen biosynthesis protein
MPTVAIVVLSYNALDITKRFVDYLFSHTKVEQFRVLFIDNGSSDSTPEFLIELSGEKPNVSVNLQPTNTGVIGGRNIGFDWFVSEVDDCDLLLFLDNDQFVQEGWLEHHLSVLDSGYDMVGVEAWQMNIRFAPIKHITDISDWFTYVGCGGMMMWRHVVDVLGGFDERFNPSYFEDPDYNFRSLDAGFSIGWNVNAKIVHMPHQTLGNAPDKQQRFLRSYQQFQAKWRGRNAQRLKQSVLPEFDL